MTAMADAAEFWRERAGQLQTALDSRIVLEQAKGVLRERYGLSIHDSFLLLRGAARSARLEIHVLAADVVAGADTPPPIEAALRRAEN